MKNLLICLFTLILNLTLAAQTYKIEGLAKSDNNEALPFATVALYKTQDSSLVKANVADENGGFKLSNIGAGQYFIAINSVGFQKLQSPVFMLSDKDLVLPPYVLKAETKALKEVVVTSRKPIVEVLADKTVFNVQNTLSATGTNAFELLRKAPGVIIDNNDNLIVEGKTGVQIYIDGKPSVLSGPDLISYLKTLQASDIEAVEIITQPSARYDAAGNAGIVNIRLKKDKRFGTNGSLSIGYGYGFFGKEIGRASCRERVLMPV